MTTLEADRRGLRLIVAALVAAVLLSSLDAMIFNTALPTIVGQLHGIARMSWVPTAYLLTTVITMPVYGKLGDLVGRKWLFVVALPRPGKCFKHSPTPASRATLSMSRACSLTSPASAE